MRQKLSALDTGITANRQELKKLSAMNKKFAAKAQQLEVESHKLQILKERLGHSKLGQLQSRQGELEAALSKAQSELDEAKEHGQAAKERATSLKREIQEFNAVREKKMKEKESAIKSFKAELKAATKVCGKAQDQVQRVTIEIEQLKDDMA